VQHVYSSNFKQRNNHNKHPGEHATEVSLIVPLFVDTVQYATSHSSLIALVSTPDGSRVFYYFGDHPSCTLREETGKTTRTITAHYTSLIGFDGDHFAAAAYISSYMHAMWSCSGLVRMRGTMNKRICHFTHLQLCQSQHLFLKKD
jgi:hypothetical protein